MKQEHYHIAQLLTKYFQNSISEDEEQYLLDWLSKNDPNHALLKSFSGQQANSDLEYWKKIDLTDNLNVFRKNKRLLYWKNLQVKIRKIAASLAILIPIGALSFWFLKSHFSSNTPASIISNATQDVGPGSNKAHLKLSDGTLVELGSIKDKVEELDGTKILASESSLTYSKTENFDSEKLIYNTLVVPKAGTFQIELSDGTKVWINAMSELSFPVRFGKNERLVKLEGEAYFEVSPDAKRPFIVESSGNKIKVIGTHFNVNSYDKKFIATLLEGSVEIWNKIGEKHLLQPGFSAKIDHHIEIEKAYLPKVIAWKQGYFYFKSDPIQVVMDEIARWYDVEINYQDEIPNTIKMSGRIDRNSNLSDVLDVIEFASGAKTKIRNNQIEIVFE